MTPEQQNTLTSGIERLDEAMGGFPQGELCLICGSEDTGKTTFCFNFLLAGLQHEERVVLVSPSDPESRLEKADALGLPLRDYIETDQLIFLHQKTKAPSVIGSQADLITMLEALEQEVLPWEPTRLVIDSGVPFIELFHPEFRKTGLISALRRLSKLELSLMLTTRMPASSGAMLLRKTMEEMAGCSLHLDEQRRTDGQIQRRMVVRKLKGFPPPYPVYNFEIEDGTGIRIMDQTDTPLESPKEEVKRKGKKTEPKKHGHKTGILPFREHMPMREAEKAGVHSESNDSNGKTGGNDEAAQSGRSESESSATRARTRKTGALSFREHAAAKESESEGEDPAPASYSPREKKTSKFPMQFHVSGEK